MSTRLGLRILAAGLVALILLGVASLGISLNARRTWQIRQEQIAARHRAAGAALREAEHAEAVARLERLLAERPGEDRVREVIREETMRYAPGHDATMRRQHAELLEVLRRAASGEPTPEPTPAPSPSPAPSSTPSPSPTPTPRPSPSPSPAPSPTPSPTPTPTPSPRPPPVCLLFVICFEP